MQSVNFENFASRMRLGTSLGIGLSQTNRMASAQCDTESQLMGKAMKAPITVRSNKNLNNAIEQDHRRIKRRIRSMLGFKSMGVCEDHPIRNRAHPRAAQGAELILSLQSHGTVRGTCRMKCVQR
jgi:hypothetical protein